MLPLSSPLTLDNGFFAELEQLLNSTHAKEHYPLLSWIVQYLRAARDHGPGTPTRIEQSVSLTDGASVGEKLLPSSGLEELELITQKKKKQLAMEQRERLMAHISLMQRRFLDAHQQELEEVDMANNEEG